MKLFNILSLFSLSLLLTSCAIVPMYDIEKAEYCKKEDYDTVCEGKRKKPYRNDLDAFRSVYDLYN